MNQTDDGKAYARRTCFAQASELMPRLNQRGISEADLWDYVKADYGVDSRSELTAEQWLRTAARLKTAQNYRQMFGLLCETIKTHKLFREVADAETEAA